MTFKHPKLDNSPDFPHFVAELPVTDDGLRQLCWGPSAKQVVEYIIDNKIAEYPLNIAVGIMMIATKGRCNPQLVTNTLLDNGCS